LRYNTEGLYCKHRLTLNYMTANNELRPIYSELQGYLSQAPTPKTGSDNIYDDSIWQQFHGAISELNGVTKKNYDRFKLEIKRTIPYEGVSEEFVGLHSYRGKLGGLISSLHGEYFHDEPPPFAGMPTTEAP
jgi:hypothetical protein